MSLQIIKAVNGKPEYVLLPLSVYSALRGEINAELKRVKNKKDEYVPFDVADYIDNPVALARIKAHITQKQLAARMGVTQAYISKIEHQETVSVNVLKKN